jgi:hypothetical protein
MRRRCRTRRVLLHRLLREGRLRDSFVITAGIGGLSSVESAEREFVGWSVRMRMRLRGA